MRTEWHNKKVFSEEEINQIKDMYTNSNLSTAKIGEIFNVSKEPISRILSELNLLRKGRSNGKKINLSEEIKEKIKDLYLIHKKNCTEIGKELNLKPSYINKYLNMAGFRRNKSEATTLSVTGRKVSEKGIENMKRAQRSLVVSGKRKQTGGVCKTYFVNGLKCQGNFEKKYIELLINDNQLLPEEGKGLNTPFGTYYPDFQYKNKLVEIKSPYTYDVLLGKKKSRWSNKFEYNQLQKIKWINSNIMPVEIAIVDKNNINYINL